MFSILSKHFVYLHKPWAKPQTLHQKTSKFNSSIYIIEIVNWKPLEGHWLPDASSSCADEASNSTRG